jgi:hypothetical protein
METKGHINILELKNTRKEMKNSLGRLNMGLKSQCTPRQIHRNCPL